MSIKLLHTKIESVSSSVLSERQGACLHSIHHAGMHFRILMLLFHPPADCSSPVLQRLLSCKGKDKDKGPQSPQG